MNDVVARHFHVRLARARQLSPSVRSLVFRADEDSRLCWNAGQYVELQVAAGRRRPYSIASAMGIHGENEFELAVALASSGEMLEGLSEGARLAAFGPSGGLRRPRAGRPSVFLAAGTGVSPFRAIIQDELLRGGDAPLLLLFGCRTEADILWRSELAELALEHPRFRFEPTLSQAESSWSGRRGWVQDHFAELIEPLARAGADFYVCGVSAMIEDCVRRLVSEHGAERDQVVTERC